MDGRTLVHLLTILLGLAVVPDDVPPALLWEFRLVALGQLAVLWAALGLVFGLLVSRRSTAHRAAATAPR